MNPTEDSTRRTTNQSRYSQPQQQPHKLSRLTSSPLKTPLQSALSKVVTAFGKETGNFGQKKRAVSPGKFGSTPRSRSRILNTSLTKNINNFSVDNSEEEREALDKMNVEPMEFLKKYFSGYTANMIPTASFVDFLTTEYNTLWSEPQAQAVLPEFKQKVMDKLGSETVNIVKLYHFTKENGLIGFILYIFKELKQEQDYLDESKCSLGGLGNPGVFEAPSSRYITESKLTIESCSPQIQNVKNIIQEFTEGLYKTTQNQIYAKINAQMRKLVMKYKQTEGLLKTVNQRINQDIDKLHYEKKKTQLEKSHEAAVQKLQDKIKALQAELHKERLTSASLRADTEKYATQNKRLADTVDKFQTHLLLKKSNEDSAIHQAGKNKTSTISYVTPNNSHITTTGTPTHTVIGFTYKSPPQQIPKTIINHAPDNKKHTQIPTPSDKQNIVTINSLNGTIRPTTPIKCSNLPSASPNKLLRVQRH